jgi:hypothetical protein
MSGRERVRTLSQNRSQNHSQNPGMEQDPSIGVRVEGEPDDERVLAVIEWLLYRRGPLARSMRKLG